MATDYRKLFNNTIYKPSYTQKELDYMEDPVFGRTKIPDGFKLIQDQDGNGLLWPQDLVLNSQTEKPKEPQNMEIIKAPGEDNGEINKETDSNNYSFNVNLNNNKQSTALYIMNSLINKGRKPHEAAGMVGNLLAESDLNPNSINENDLGNISGGIAQWRGSNFARLKAYAKSQGKSWNDLDLQIDFLNNSIDSDVLDRLSKSKDAHQASEAWAYYEKYAGYDGTTKTAKKAKWSQNRINEEHNKRSKYSNYVFDLWKSQS